MISIITDFLKKIKAMFTPEPEKIAAVQELPAAAVPGPALEDPDPATTPENRDIEDPGPASPLRDGPSGWVVTIDTPRPFEKVGRLIMDGTDLLVYSDLDPRGFYLPDEDLDAALTGDTGKVRVIGSPATVGTAHLSTSGRALNITIGQQLYTVPLRSLSRMLNGGARKAPLFCPADDLRPDIPA
jgi:hypothetical protein